MAYSGNPNNSLLVGLYEAVHGKKVENVGKKYFEDTQTMYHDARVKNSANDVTVNSSIKEFLLDKEQYKKIAEERVRHLIVKENNFLINEEICIVEVDGLKQTGRRLYKYILDIETSIENEGLKDTYMIISF